MQRVLYQLTELGTVWKGVLPASVYAASLGRLLDSVALEMVYRVEAVEDIAELTGPHLQVTRRAVQQRGLRAAPNVSLCVCVCVHPSDAAGASGCVIVQMPRQPFHRQRANCCLVCA